MWIQTRFGFFSIVRKADDISNGTLTIRARVAGDLEALRDHFLPEMGPIQQTPRNDYRYRAKSPQGAAANAMAKAMMDINYSNFKSEVAKKQGKERANLYGKVWGVLYDMQDNPLYKSASKAEAVHRSKAKTRTAETNLLAVNLPTEDDVIISENKRSTSGLSENHEEIPSHQQLPATHASWPDLQPMPEQFTTIQLDFWLNPSQAESIKLGFIPKMMEEKWFFYFESNTLYMHRSWTGICIDQIHFVEENGGLRATHAEVNRNHEQYGETQEDEDKKRIEQLVNEFADMDRGDSRIDPMAAAFMTALQPNYLGSPETVGKILAPFFDATVEYALADPTNRRDAFEKTSSEIARLVQIFSGNHPNYTALTTWNSREELGEAVIRYFNLDKDYYAGDSIEAVLSEGLTGLKLFVTELLKTSITSQAETEAVKAKLGEVFRFVRDVLLGSNVVTYPNKTLKDFSMSQQRNN